MCMPSKTHHYTIDGSISQVYLIPRQELVNISSNMCLSQLPTNGNTEHLRNTYADNKNGTVTARVLRQFQKQKKTSKHNKHSKRRCIRNIDILLLCYVASAILSVILFQLSKTSKTHKQIKRGWRESSTYSYFRLCCIGDSGVDGSSHIPDTYFTSHGQYRPIAEIVKTCVLKWFLNTIPKSKMRHATNTHQSLNASDASKDPGAPAPS